MSTVVKDLGAVSAYAYAVEKGYTGTEAEFAELMADYAEVGQRAEDAADSALESKTAAQTAATTATNKASEATTAATTATNKAAEAQADADAAALDASQALSAASTATTKATEATTAAATAVSAKNDAVSANTAAQSAKTAAQTAQTGAETAAASVQSSASQIAQNTSDISELKEDLNVVFDGGYLPLPITYIDGGYIDQTNGNVAPYSNWHYTDFIDISQREENKIYFQTSGATSVYNVFYDSNRQFLGPLNDNKGYVPDGFVPENAHYMRLSCRSVTTQTLKIYKTEYVTEEKLSSLVKSNPVITVANFNVGLFNNGISGVSQAEAPQQMVKFRKIIGKIDADIFNTQEFQQYFDTDSTYLARNNVMRFKYPYDTYDTRSYGSLGFSKYPISNVSKTDFVSESGKYYISYDVKLFNKVLTIIDAHLAIEQDPTVHRQSEIAELIAFMNTKDYVILTGDFNVASQSEYNAFKTAGYTLCNGGDFGWFDTWPIYDNMPSGWTTQWPCFNLDNIIVSSNIVPQYVEAFECDISDHAPFVAELRID